MTYLELFQRLHQESGIAGSTPTTIVGQTGKLAKLVNWVLSAYEDIQNLHPQGWKFLQDDFSFSTTATEQNYTPADAGITAGLSEWKTDTGSTRIYSATTDEVELVYHEWDIFRLAYKTGSNRDASGRPSVYSIKYDNSLELWQIPDDVFTVNGEYFMIAQTMDEDADEPLIPSQFQMIIVWRALMFYAADVGADELYAHGRNEYKRLLASLERNQLPRIGYGKPLA